MMFAACRRFINGLFGLLMTLTCTVALAQADKPDCQCRASGGVMYDLGTVECVDIAGRKKLVVCTMSTNTPYWRDIEGGQKCPAA